MDTVCHTLSPHVAARAQCRRLVSPGRASSAACPAGIIVCVGTLITDEARGQVCPALLQFCRCCRSGRGSRGSGRPDGGVAGAWPASAGGDALNNITRMVCGGRCVVQAAGSGGATRRLKTSCFVMKWLMSGRKSKTINSRRWSRLWLVRHSAVVELNAPWPGRGSNCGRSPKITHRMITKNKLWD